MVKPRRLALILTLMLILTGTNQVFAEKSTIFKYKDLNYHYQLNWIGWVRDYLAVGEGKSQVDLKESIPRKLLIELTIESINGGLDWLPLNPVITDDLNNNYRDYKVVVEPTSGNTRVSIKYLVTAPLPKKAKVISFFEEGISWDGKKAYRVWLRNLPFPSE